MTMPNFLIIGAAKSGTSALYEHLKQHPQIYMSPWKEPKFFAFEGEEPDFRGPHGSDAPVNRTAVTDRGRYEALFDDATDEERLGEATALYLYVEKAPHRIRHHVPDAKLIAVLRNPVDRAFSSYQHLVREGLEPMGFREALAAEPQRIEENWGFLWRYVDMGWYASQLTRYYELFDENQIKVLLHDDLLEDPIRACRDIFRFLEVDDTFCPDVSQRYNVSGVPRSRLLHRLLNPPSWTQRRIASFIPDALRDRIRTLQARITATNLQRQEMPEGCRQYLQEVFASEIECLEELLGRPLSRWR